MPPFGSTYLDYPDIPPDFEEIVGRAIYLIMDMRGRKLNVIKDQVIKLIMSLQTDDKVGVYGENYTGLAMHHGVAVAQVADYNQQTNFNIDHAMRAAFTYLAEAPDSRKIVIVITESYTPKHSYVYQKAFDQNVFRGYGCKFGIISLGEFSPDGAVKVNKPEDVLEKLLEIVGD